MRTKKVLVVCASSIDATSFYRAWGCLYDIQKRYDIVFDAYEDYKGFTWKNVIQYDMAIFQRAAGGASQLAKYFKDAGIPIVYDLDDNFWEIPATFNIKEHFNSATLGTIEDCINMADMVTTSTEALSNYIYNLLGVKCETINNGIDLNKYPILPYNNNGATIWRGSETHKTDLREFREVFESIETEIEFWGFDPVRSSPYLNVNKSIYVKGLDPIVYFNTLRAKNISTILSYLIDDEFNRCKSNIAWIEATMCGAVCMSNGVGEFKNVPHIKELDTDNEQRQSIYNESKQLVEDKYNLQRLNDRRFELYMNLMHG